MFTVADGIWHLKHLRRSGKTQHPDKILYGYAESSSEATITTKDTKEKSKIMCFPFVIFVFFVVMVASLELSA
jgi:hypothetical protein